MKSEHKPEVEGFQDLDEETGANLIEYTLLASLIALVCIVAVRVLGDDVSSKISGIASGINSN